MSNAKQWFKDAGLAALDGALNGFATSGAGYAAGVPMGTAAKAAGVAAVIQGLLSFVRYRQTHPLQLE